MNYNKIIYNLILLSVITLSCSENVKNIDGLYFPKDYISRIDNPNFKFNDPFLIIFHDTLYTIYRLNGRNSMDTLTLSQNKNIFTKNRMKFNFKIINDSLIEIRGGNYFNNDSVFYVKQKSNYIKQNKLDVKKITNKYWYTKDKAFVDDRYIDTAFYFLDIRKKRNRNILYFYDSSIDRKDATIESWEYLNVGGFDILRLQHSFPTYLFINNASENEIRGILYLLLDPPVNYNLHKKKDDDGYFIDIEKRRKKEKDSIILNTPIDNSNYNFFNLDSLEFN